MDQAVNPLVMARAIADVVTRHAAEAEALRTLPPVVVQALWDSGLMQCMNPVEAGGMDPGFGDLLAMWIELARQDASVGWIGIANLPSAAFAAAYLPDAGFDEIFRANDNRITMGGQFFPNGTGAEVDGGYQVTGSWQFGSGTGHSEYVVGGFIPLRNGEMPLDANGLPEMLIAIFPREQVTFTDGWHVTGLRATGSYDYHVSEVFVPVHRTYPLFTREPRRGTAAGFRMGVMPLTAAGHAGWALGVARGALDDVTRLAQEKTRMGDPATLGNKLTFQRDLAHREAQWRAARLLVLDTFCGVEAAINRGEPLSVSQRADMRMAATYATQACREVVEFAHLAAGTAAIREGSRLERAFRDMYTGTQHAFINEKTYTDAAQVMLGLIADSPGL